MSGYTGNPYDYSGAQTGGGPQGPGFMIGPNGAPMFVPSGAAGWRQRAAAEGVGSGGPSSPNVTGAAGGDVPGNGALGAGLGGGGTSSNTASGSGFGGLNITGRDVATTGAQVGLGLVGTLLGGPLAGMAAGAAGKYGMGALYDYLAGNGTPSTAMASPQNLADLGGTPSAAGVSDILGSGALGGTMGLGLSGIGDITAGGTGVGSGPAGAAASGAIDFSGINGSPGINASAGPQAVGDITAGGMGDAGSANVDVNGGDPGENVNGSGLHARGGRIRKHRPRRRMATGGALSQRLGATR